jgi:hypothetical protein
VLWRNAVGEGVAKSLGPLRRDPTGRLLPPREGLQNLLPPANPLASRLFKPQKCWSATVFVRPCRADQVSPSADKFVPGGCLGALDHAAQQVGQQRPNTARFSVRTMTQPGWPAQTRPHSARHGRPPMSLITRVTVPLPCCGSTYADIAGVADWAGPDSSIAATS